MYTVVYMHIHSIVVLLFSLFLFELNACENVYIYIYTHKCVYIYIYTCVYIYIYIYIYML